MFIFIVIAIVLSIGIYAIVRLTSNHTRDIDFYDSVEE